MIPTDALTDGSRATWWPGSASWSAASTRACWTSGRRWPTRTRRTAKAGTVRPPIASRGITANERGFTVLVRNALFRRVELAAREDYETLGELDADAGWTAPPGGPTRWTTTSTSTPTWASARSPAARAVRGDRRDPAVWTVRQIFDDPAGDRDWGITAAGRPGRLRRGRRAGRARGRGRPGLSRPAARCTAGRDVTEATMASRPASARLGSPNDLDPDADGCPPGRGRHDPGAAAPRSAAAGEAGVHGHRRRGGRGHRDHPASGAGDRRRPTNSPAFDSAAPTTICGCCCRAPASTRRCCRSASCGGPRWWPWTPRSAPFCATTRCVTCVRDVAELDIDLVRHGDAGPGSRWAGSARVGDRVGIIDQGLLHEIDHAARNYLVIGDETALPAAAGVIADLRAGVEVRALLEVPSAADVIDLPTAADLDVTWLIRADPHTRPGMRILDTLPTLARPQGRVACLDRRGVADDDGDPAAPGERPEDRKARDLLPRLLPARPGSVRRRGQLAGRAERPARPYRCGAGRTTASAAAAGRRPPRGHRHRRPVRSSGGWSNRTEST